MRRLATAAVLPCSVVLFVLLAPIAAADETTPSTTTSPPPTTTEPPATATTPTIPSRSSQVRVPRLIQPGVTIGGLLVGGLTTGEARQLVAKRFGKPITLVVSPTRKLRVTPDDLGAAAYVGKAVKTAVGVRREGYQVPLRIDVANPKLQRFLAGIAKQTDREPVDASLTLRNFTPVAHPSSPGRRLMKVVAAQKLALALRKHESAFELPFQELRPKVTEADLGKVIVIKRASNQLLYFDGDKLKRSFRVATGQSSYPTPHRQVRDRHDAAQPVVVPAGGLRLGRGRRADPAGPGQPARHALDGHLVAVRRHPRDAGRRVDRLLGLARLHPDADPAGRVAVQAGRRGDAGVHRPGVSSEAGAGRIQRVAQVVALVGVAALLGLLIWKVAFGNDTGAADELAQGKLVQRRRSRSTASTATESSASPT